MEDPASLATVEVLTKAHPPALFTDANLTFLTICKAASLSLERGNCDASCLANVLLSGVAGPCFGDYRVGFRFGQPRAERPNGPTCLTRPSCAEVQQPALRVDQLHWRLDVVMNEDQDRNRLGNAPQNLAVLRHMALNVMQKHLAKGSLRGEFKRAGWDDGYLRQLLALF